MRLKAALDLLKQTFSEWNEDKAPLLAAALAYYTIFSLAPLLIIVIAIAGFVFGEEAVRGEIVGQIQGLVGREGAEVIQEMLKNAYHPGKGIIATLIGFVTLLLGASGVFAQLQEALNIIWNVKPKPGRGIKGIIKDRFLSFTMVVGIGFLLLVSLVISTVLAAISNFLNHLFPDFSGVLHLVSFALSFAIVTFLFGMIYKVLPDVKISWNDVSIGAAMTALLFMVGQYLLGVYLGNSGFTSTYGAAGAFVVILVWIYYSAQILFLGAEFTQVYARTYGSQILPSNNTMPASGNSEGAEPSSHSRRTNRRSSRQSGWLGFLQRLAGKKRKRYR